MDNNDQQLSAAGVCPSARVQHTWFLCLIDAEIKSYYIIGVIRTTDYEYPSHSPANLLLIHPHPPLEPSQLCAAHMATGRPHAQAAEVSRQMVCTAWHLHN